MAQRGGGGGALSLARALYRSGRNGTAMRLRAKALTAVSMTSMASMAARALLPMLALASTAWSASLPSFAEVRAAHQSSDIQVLDRHGEPIQTMRADMRQRRLPWVRLQDVSPAMRLAIVLSEDQRFWQHSGVDWGAAAASAWGNLWNQRTRGASTVSMQLAGLLQADDTRRAGRRNWPQKLTQAWSASRLDGQWRKSEILEAYLNLVPFRGELVGLPALTQTLFHKHPNGLDAQESAMAAALVRGPNASPAVVARRACQVLTLQSRSCQGIDLLAAAALSQKGGAMLGEQIAPHFARQLLGSNRGAIRSTLDARWQRLAMSLLQRHLSELSSRDVEDGAVIVLDNASGDVLAWVGGSGDFSSAPDVDAVVARRQPGSTLKPFVYAMAFEQRLLTPASLLHDAPVQLPTGAGLYIPQNYDRRFKGWVSVRTALGNSLNVPAVRAGALLGPDQLAQRLNQLGLGLKEAGGFYGPGLALGSAEVTLRDLANAYRALANGGLWSPVRMRLDEASAPAKMRPVPHRVMDPAAAYLVTDILADNTARALTFGLDSVLATRGFAAVKTGTSKDMRDNWCIGYTSRYTVGVWVGNASGSPMHDVSGVSGAAPIWAALVRELHRAEVSHVPPMPAGVVRLGISFDDAMTMPSVSRSDAAPIDVSRQELFMAGTEQARWSLAEGQGANRGIRLPQDGAIFAIDPDMPPLAQRITLATDKPHAVWWLDGRRLGAARSMNWAPWPGKHELSLRQGTMVIDQLHFEVRGAGLKPTRAGDKGHPDAKGAGSAPQQAPRPLQASVLGPR
jgi:penicillin-binding protein 1C